MRAETIQTYPLPETSPAVTTEQFIRFTEGDEKGLVWLYQQYYDKLLRYGLRIVTDEFAVNTIVQEAFLKAWTFRDRLLHPPARLLLHASEHQMGLLRPPEPHY